MGFFTNLAAAAISNYIDNKDNDDTLRTLVFLAGHNSKLGIEEKKLIIQAFSVQCENASLFEYEEKIDSIQKELKSTSIDDFFSNILSTRINRDKIVSFFTLDICLYLRLATDEIIQPSQMYNLYLLKNKFELSKSELISCYRTVSSTINLDFDMVAKLLEFITDENSIQMLLNKYPNMLSGTGVEENETDENSEYDDEDEETDYDEFSYSGSIEDGEILLKKWNDIFTRDIETLFDEKSLSTSKTEGGNNIIADKDSEFLFTASNNFEEDDDAFFILQFTKKEKTLFYSYNLDENDNMKLCVRLFKQDDISLEFEIEGSDACYFEDFISYMESLNIEIPDDFTENLKSFVIKLYKKHLEGTKARISDLDDF